MTNSELIQIILMGLLVVVTGIYAWRTFAISNATKKQADATKQQAEASVKMAEEMRKEGRPYVIQKAVYEEDIPGRSAFHDSFHFTHFEIYNAGKSPAIELLTCLKKDGAKCPFDMRREPFFLKAGESTKFCDHELANLEKSAKYYLICQYRSTFEKTCYQTKLPFEPVELGREEKGKIHLKAGELEFYDEVPENERIVF